MTSLDLVFHKIIAAHHRCYKHCVLTGLQFEGQYSQMVSCTHAAPRGKPTNFFCKPELPTHYPGVFGRVWLKKLQLTPQSEFFLDSSGQIMLHTGTGGAGSYGGPWCREQIKTDEHIYSYDARVFLDDFPEMQPLEREWVRSLDLIRKNALLSKMAGKRSAYQVYNEMTHAVPVSFFWEQ